MKKPRVTRPRRIGEVKYTCYWYCDDPAARAEGYAGGTKVGQVFAPTAIDAVRAAIAEVVACCTVCHRASSAQRRFAEFLRDWSI